MWKISLIVVSLSLLGAKCNDYGDLKVYNVEAFNNENSPGLVRRKENGDILERISFDAAHKDYGCMSWDDWSEIIDQGNRIMEDMGPWPLR